MDVEVRNLLMCPGSRRVPDAQAIVWKLTIDRPRCPGHSATYSTRRCVVDVAYIRNMLPRYDEHMSRVKLTDIQERQRESILMYDVCADTASADRAEDALF